MGDWLDAHSSCGLDQWRGVLLTRVDPVDVSSVGEGISHGGEGWRVPSSSEQQGPRVQAAQVFRGWLWQGESALSLRGNPRQSPLRLSRGRSLFSCAEASRLWGAVGSGGVRECGCVWGPQG